MKKICIYAMGLKGLSCINAIIKNGYASSISAVISSKDMGVKNDYYNEIEVTCSNSGITFYNRNEKPIIQTEFTVAIAWRWLINVQDSQNLIVLHDSLLPKYRGFAPLVNSLVNGETIIGVTALYASEEYDKGDIIMQSSLAISYPIRVEEAIDKITACYKELVLSITKSIFDGKQLIAKKQKEENATYSLWLDTDDYIIDWKKSANEIKRFIDSVGFPYSGALTTINGEKRRIIDVEVYPDVVIENRCPGKVIFNIDSLPIIVCGKGLIKLLKMEDENGNQQLPLKNFRTRFT